MDNPADQNTIPVPEINNPAPPAADIPLTPPVSPPSPEGIVAPPKKSSKGFPKPLILSLSLLLFVTATALGVYYVQKEGLPFNVGKKAALIGDCDDGGGGCCSGQGECGCRDWEVCDVSNGACASGTSCRTLDCKGNGNSCSENWQCCSGSCSNGSCSGGDSGTTCTMNVHYSGATTPGSDCGQGGSASVSVEVCASSGCQSNQVFNYQKAVANCSGLTGCGGSCGSSWESGSLSVSPGECKTITVSCNPPDSCGSCQVDVKDNTYYPDGYGVRRLQNSGCAALTPSPTNTPTSTVTPEPSNTPTPTPTQGATPCCSNVTLTKVDAEGKPLEGTDFKIGDRVKIAVTLEGTVENVLIRIKKDGVKIHDEQAGLSKSNGWSYIYKIPSTGEYEVLSFVKVNGIWK